jgi:hypothetical protein
MFNFRLEVVIVTLNTLGSLEILQRSGYRSYYFFLLFLFFNKFRLEKFLGKYR